MRIFISYVSGKRKFICLLGLFIVMHLAVFFLYSLPLAPVLYTMELEGTILAIATVVDYIGYKKKYTMLLTIIQEDEVYEVEMPVAGNEVEEFYQKVIATLVDRNYQLSENDHRKMSELKDYYAVWAHQIKTPISAIDLLLQVTRDDATQLSEQNIKELKNQLFQIDFYVDAVMNYLRLDDMSSDFEFETYSVEGIVHKAVKKFATQFIGKKISVELTDLDMQVYTDEKWLGFVLEQLLSNAIKYTQPGGCIRIYRRTTINADDRVIVIEDNGIGIASEDIPRIFERGYTGYNGRMNQKSSGIGLYLSKMALDKLGNTITIESEVGKGTKVVLNLSKYLTKHE